MGTFTSLFLILGGVLCLTGMIVKQKPEIETTITKVDQIAGWAGFILMIWSVIFFIWVLAKLGDLRFQRLVSTARQAAGESGWSPFFWWFTNFAISLLSMLVGFILGLPILQKLLLEKTDDQTQVKIADFHTALVGKKNLFGFIAAGAGLWGLIYNIVVHSRMPSVAAIGSNLPGF